MNETEFGELKSDVKWLRESFSRIESKMDVLTWKVIGMSAAISTIAIAVTKALGV